MITVKQYIAENEQGFEFKGEFQGNSVGLVLTKSDGQLLINADDAAKIFGSQDFGDLLSKDEDLSDAFLDDLNENYIEFSNTQMLLIMQDINKIEDKELRLSLINKLGV